MPYQIPRLGEIISQTQQDVAQSLPGALPAQDRLLEGYGDGAGRAVSAVA